MLTHYSTDASAVDIVLINNAVYPTVSEKIASGIDTSKGSYTASGLKGVTNGQDHLCDASIGSTYSSLTLL